MTSDSAMKAKKIAVCGVQAIHANDGMSAS
jgi:hypothetical protein